ncbi:hypothetical protein KKG22_04910 [Patescibacteria group bacterium]|nr:hypothetical protein [Patescibacteria group bacterium]MBU1721676.1 hypothetical protein [Patescibacteria group bacterium]MBU1900985.1 hypothetical protein [Patescibacteria group bacterium]
MDNALSQSIYHTLVYFDLFSYPLTREELYQYLWEGPKLSYAEFFKALEQLDDDRIVFSEGYYMLAGKQAHITVRRKRQWFVAKKMKIAKKAAKLYRYIPFVQAVYVCNQIQIGVDKDSDIDVFIVVKQGRIWITRFLVTMITALRGIRRSNKKTTDRICLSFYGVDTALNFSAIRIDSSPDIYLAYWLKTLIPIYDPHHVYRRIQLENTWADAHVRSKYEVHVSKEWFVKDHRMSKIVKRFFEIAWKGAYGDMVNNLAKGLQDTKMKKNRKSIQYEADSRVIISDNILKFHENDRRKLFQKLWQEAVA